MLVGDISVHALNAHGEVRGDEQVENTIDAVSGNPSSLRSGHGFGNVISRRRTIETSKHLEDRFPHGSPLLAAIG